MAEIKREIRTLGQRLSGLTAGNTYTFVLKRPNVRVDVFNAIRCLELAEEQITQLRKLLATLERLRDQMAQGGGSARASLAAEKATLRQIVSGVADAKEFALRAADDAKDAHADVKDAYTEAKDGAEQAVAAAEALLSGMGDIMKSLTALCIDAEISESAPAGSSTANSSQPPNP